MITHEFATRFTEEWVADWNSHDLDHILSHYADDFEMSSPYIQKIVGETSGLLKGKATVAAYWAKALGRMPGLHFELHCTLVGTDSLVIYYKGAKGMAAEFFSFGPNGKVMKSCAHYCKLRAT